MAGRQRQPLVTGEKIMERVPNRELRAIRATRGNFVAVLMRWRVERLRESAMENHAPNRTNPFFPVPTQSISSNTSAHFDVYALVGAHQDPPTNDDFLLYAKAPYEWTDRELTELTRLGIRELFVHNSQKKFFDRYQNITCSQPPIDTSLEPRLRIQKIQDLGKHLVEAAFLAEVDEALVQKFDNVAVMVVDCLADDVRSVRCIQSLADHDQYTYVHCVGVGILTCAIAWTMGERDKQKLREYTLGGILHDLGKRCTPLRILNKQGPLTTDEWEIMKKHPSQGSDLLKAFSFSEIIKNIVQMHHEKVDGSGYPDNLMAQDIPDYVQIATVADIFNALSTTRPYHFKRSRFEALKFMKENLGSKISNAAFGALVTSLVAEPDGSITGWS